MEDFVTEVLRSDDDGRRRQFSHMVSNVLRITTIELPWNGFVMKPFLNNPINVSTASAGDKFIADMMAKIVSLKFIGSQGIVYFVSKSISLTLGIAADICSTMKSISTLDP